MDNGHFGIDHFGDTLIILAVKLWLFRSERSFSEITVIFINYHSCGRHRRILTLLSMR